MKTKSLFSLAFYRDTLLRLRMFGIICAIVFGILSAIGSFTYLLLQVGTDFIGLGGLIASNISLVDISGSLATFIGIIIPIMTAYSFSYLMKRKGSDFFEVLPISRSAMAVSAMLAVLTVSAFVIAVTSLVAFLALIPCMGKTVEYDALLGLWQALSFVVSALLAVATSALAVSVSGTTVNAVITSYIFLYVPRTLLGHINTSLLSRDSTLVEGHIIPFFDKKFNTLFALYRGETVLTDVWSFIYTILIAGALAFLAVLLFRRRPSEAATHSFANPIARHVARILIATLLSSTGIMLFCIEPLLLIISIILVILSIGAYFIYELITGRKEGKFLSSLVTFPIYLVLNGFIILFIVIASAVTGSFSPTAGEIDSVSIVSNTDKTFGVDYADYVTIRSEGLLLKDAETKEAIAKALDRGDSEEDNANYVRAVFKIKKGARTAYRQLWLSYDEYLSMLSTLAEKPEYEQLWLNVADGASEPEVYVDGVTITGSGAERILAAAERDVSTLGFDTWCALVSGATSYAQITYTAEYDGEKFEVTLPIFEEMAETVKACERERKAEAAKELSRIEKMITDAISGKGEGVYLDVWYAYGYEEIYTEIYFDSNDESSRELYETLFGMISVDYEGEATVDLYCYGEGLFSSYRTLSLSLKEGVTSEEMIYFLKKCGAEVGGEQIF